MSNFKSLFRKKGEAASQIESTEADNPRFAALFRKVGSNAATTSGANDSTADKRFASLFRKKDAKAELPQTDYPELNKLTHRYGVEKGFELFAAGKSLKDALVEECAMLQAEIDAMETRTANAEGKLAVMRECRSFVDACQSFKR